MLTGHLLKDPATRSPTISRSRSKRASPARRSRARSRSSRARREVASGAIARVKTYRGVRDRGRCLVRRPSPSSAHAAHASRLASRMPRAVRHSPRLAASRIAALARAPKARRRRRPGQPARSHLPRQPSRRRRQARRAEEGGDPPRRQHVDLHAADGRSGVQLRRARLPGRGNDRSISPASSRRTASRSRAASPAFRPRGRATWGSGKPVISLGSDIDDIPQANQKPGVGYKDPMVTGAPGHGEGHNSGVPMNITAAIAVKKIMEREHIPGTIHLWPGVAEELMAGKAYFVRAGDVQGRRRRAVRARRQRHGRLVRPEPVRRR